MREKWTMLLLVESAVRLTFTTLLTLIVKMNINCNFFSQQQRFEIRAVFNMLLNWIEKRAGPNDGYDLDSFRVSQAVHETLLLSSHFTRKFMSEINCIMSLARITCITCTLHKASFQFKIYNFSRVFDFRHVALKLERSLKCRLDEVRVKKNAMNCKQMWL